MSAVYRCVGLVVLPAFPVVALVNLIASERPSVLGCMRRTWAEWRFEFWDRAAREHWDYIQEQTWGPRCDDCGCRPLACHCAEKGAAG